MYTSRSNSSSNSKVSLLQLLQLLQQNFRSSFRVIAPVIASLAITPNVSFKFSSNSYSNSQPCYYSSAFWDLGEFAALTPRPRELAHSSLRAPCPPPACVPCDAAAAPLVRYDWNPFRVRSPPRMRAPIRCRARPGPCSCARANSPAVCVVQGVRRRLAVEESDARVLYTILELNSRLVGGVSFVPEICIICSRKRHT